MPFQIVKVFGQSSEPPDKIFDYLYLGNEWNASNLTELKKTGITHVLNVTMEIANFFSHEFVYKTIRWVRCYRNMTCFRLGVIICFTDAI